MVVMVMDGQGGGIGSVVIKALRSAVTENVEILALGTNSAATARMMKAGANRGATGENAIVQMAPRADVIMGPLAILMAHAMMGEVTPRMAQAVSMSNARKILIPLTQEKVRLVGITADPLPHLVEEAVKVVKEIMGYEWGSPIFVGKRPRARILEDVDAFDQVGDEVNLRSIFGEKVAVKAKLKSFSLVYHKIILVPV